MISALGEPTTFGAFMAIYQSGYNDYIEIFLNSPAFRTQLEGISTTTINQITQNNLKSTVIPLPPLEEQKRIVAKVEELMALVDKLEAQLAASRDAGAKLIEAVVAAIAAAA